MPKRSADAKIEHYLKKIEKLKKKRRTILQSSSNSDSDNPNQEEIPSTADFLEYEIIPNEINTAPSNEEIVETILMEGNTVETNPVTSNLVETVQVGTNQTETTPVEVAPLVEAQIETNTPSAALDPSILEALGEVVDESPDFGVKIHDSLAKIYTPILKKGMPKDIRQKMLKDYLIPENCPLLKSPTLNPEILAAIPETGRYRDKKIYASQSQLGVGITAINRGLNTLLSSDNKIEAIKSISDGCRLLSDLHYQNTETRKKFITPALDKSFLQLIQVTERDDTLFGNKLSEKIKASKAITTQGHQIKKNPMPQKASTSYSQNATRANNQGNWQGPPRFPTNRGGRGGFKRFNQRVPVPPMASQPQTKPVQHKTRGGAPRHQQQQQ